MMIQVSDLLPGVPPLSIVTVVGVCLMSASLLLYLISRAPELLLIMFISSIYAVVPVLSMAKHF